jgi:hypothetical protein
LEICGSPEGTASGFLPKRWKVPKGLPSTIDAPFSVGDGKTLEGSTVIPHARSPDTHTLLK